MIKTLSLNELTTGERIARSTCSRHGLRFNTTVVTHWRPTKRGNWMCSPWQTNAPKKPFRYTPRSVTRGFQTNPLWPGYSRRWSWKQLAWKKKKRRISREKRGSPDSAPLDPLIALRRPGTEAVSPSFPVDPLDRKKKKEKRNSRSKYEIHTAYWKFLIEVWTLFYRREE